jgi:YVTN family beta-propeller protein
MEPQRNVRSIGILATLLVASALADGQSAAPMRLEKTVPLPSIQGRIDHMAFDSEHKRLFVAALGNNTVEVIDTQNGTVLKSIPGLAEPQGIVYQPEKSRLWVANGADGSIRIFDAETFAPLRTIHLGDDADNLRRDSVTQQIIAGYGSGAIAIFDANANQIANIKLDAHPESFQLERNGPRIFVNLPGSQKVDALDRAKSAVVARWSTGFDLSNFPMALDEPDGRLFIVCRLPATLLVMDTQSGAIISKLPTVGDSDDVFYDQERRRIYVSGGEGAIAVYQQQDRDHYSKIAQLETVKGARTSLYVPELSRIFVAVRAEGKNPAAIRVYEVQK